MTLYLTVRNVGKGRSYETQANLKNLRRRSLAPRGRLTSNLAPGETRKVAFTFDVQSALADAEAKVELSVADRDLRETVVEKIKLPVVAPQAIAPASGASRPAPRARACSRRPRRRGVPSGVCLRASRPR